MVNQDLQLTTRVFLSSSQSYARIHIDVDKAVPESQTATA